MRRRPATDLPRRRYSWKFAATLYLRHDALKTEDNAFGRLIILNIQQIVFEKSLNEQKNNVKRSVLATGANENIDSLCNITYFTIETNEWNEIITSI